MNHVHGCRSRSIHIRCVACIKAATCCLTWHIEENILMSEGGQFYGMFVHIVSLGGLSKLDRVPIFHSLIS